MMFSTAVVLSVSLTSIFAETFYPSIIRGSPRLVPQKEPSSAQGDQFYPPNMQQLPMEGNQQMYQQQQPMPQQPMMQQPMMLQPMMQQPMMQQQMMQGFQNPFLSNPMNQQQLSLMLMATYARMMGLFQLMNMQNSYQPYQLNQFSDPAASNCGKTQVPLPYASTSIQQPQQPQAEPQNNLENEMLQRQQQQAESQHQAILDDRRIKRDYDMEVERREEILKRQAEEEELEKKQKEIERKLLDEQEIERERKEYEKQILEEQQKEREQKEKDLKLREEEERRLQKIKEERRLQKIEDQSRPNQDVKLKMKISLNSNKRPRKMIKQK